MLYMVQVAGNSTCNTPTLVMKNALYVQWNGIHFTQKNMNEKRQQANPTENKDAH